MALDSLTNMVTEARALLREPTEDLFSDVEIKNWLRQGALFISAKGLCVETSGSITLVENQLEYSKPTECVKVQACFFSNKALTKVRPVALGKITGDTTGTPRYYYFFAGKLGFYPLANAAASGSDVTVLFNRASTGVLLASVEWRELIVKFAAYKGKKKEGKFSQAAQFYQEIINEMTFMRQDLMIPDVDSKDEQTIPDRKVQAS